MKRSLIGIFTLAISFISLSCSSTAYFNLDDLKTELNIKDFPDQSAYPNADALVLSEVHDVKCFIDEDYSIRTTESVTIIKKLFRNIEDNSTVEIGWEADDILTDLSARTIKPDGTVIELKKGDFYTISGSANDNELYSERKLTRFTFPAIEKNCIVEYHYIMQEAYPFIQDRWEIQGRLPKLRNAYKLTVPKLLLTPEGQGGAGWSWVYRMFNCEVVKPAVSSPLTASSAIKDQMVSFQWVRTNIPAFVPDPVMPSYDRFIQYVKFAPSDWKTWNDVSKWYYADMFRPQLVITDAVRNKAKSLTDSCTSERQMLERLTAYVQKMRYVEISLGDGGYIPAQPEKVLDRQYGDCKDKSMLLISLLKSEGISAKPVLVLTSDEGVIEPKFPSWNFNHMIVKAATKDGKNYWIDPTADRCPIGVIPSADEGVNALVLNDDSTSRIETIPSSKYTDNVDDISMTVNIGSGLESNFDIEMKSTGQTAMGDREFLEDKTHDDVIKFCKSLVADDYLNANVVDYSYSSLDSVDSAFTFNFKLIVPNAIEKQGDLIFLNIDPFKLTGDWSWLARDKRTYDIEFLYPKTITKTIELNIPLNKYDIRNIPPYSYLTTDGLYYMKNYENDGNGHLKVTETFSIRSKDISAASFNKVKNFIEAMRTKAVEKIVLTAKQ